eukprot:jgi/Chrzof1/7193/Cz02g14097.t1
MLLGSIIICSTLQRAVRNVSSCARQVGTAAATSLHTSASSSNGFGGPCDATVNSVSSLQRAGSAASSSSEGGWVAVKADATSRLSDWWLMESALVVPGSGVHQGSEGCMDAGANDNESTTAPHALQHAGDSMRTQHQSAFSWATQSPQHVRNAQSTSSTNSNTTPHLPPALCDQQQDARPVTASIGSDTAERLVSDDRSQGGWVVIR